MLRRRLGSYPALVPRTEESRSPNVAMVSLVLLDVAVPMVVPIEYKDEIEQCVS
jgi:hypothetical protein